MKKFEEIIREFIPMLQKNIQLSPESLFQRFNNMTVTEYAL
jgi:hypothetical protein